MRSLTEAPPEGSACCRRAGGLVKVNGVLRLLAVAVTALAPDGTRLGLVPGAGVIAKCGRTAAPLCTDPRRGEAFRSGVANFLGWIETGVFACPGTR
jgi:hypothetical protein